MKQVNKRIEINEANKQPGQTLSWYYSENFTMMIQSTDSNLMSNFITTCRCDSLATIHFIYAPGRLATQGREGWTAPKRLNYTSICWEVFQSPLGEDGWRTVVKQWLLICNSGELRACITWRFHLKSRPRFVAFALANHCRWSAPSSSSSLSYRCID